MGKKKKSKNAIEIRADTFPRISPEPEVGSVLLRALLGLDGDGMTREKALQIPTVQACINLISSTISRLPIQLIRKKRNGDIEIVKNDPRIGLLNDDTNDTLTAKQFWRAMLEDYYLGRGGFAYINRRLMTVNSSVESINYVDDRDISIGWQTFDPIFKDYDITVRGVRYLPSNFIKILRKTRDGMRSISIIDESSLILEVAYEELRFELANAKKGGARKGFLQSDKVLTSEKANELKNNYNRMYSNGNSDSVMVLNSGLTFKEAGATAAELQMNENKASNAEEICKLFGIPASMVTGSRTGNSMTEEDEKQFIRACTAVMTDIECSLNRDFLLADEKKNKSWKFDTKELTRGSIRERYEAYKIGLDKNFLQIDEVREKEDLEPLGIDWIQMNLNTVLYNPVTKEVYTPNTNAKANLENGDGMKPPEIGMEGGENNESGITS